MNVRDRIAALETSPRYLDLHWRLFEQGLLGPSQVAHFLELLVQAGDEDAARALRVWAQNPPVPAGDNLVDVEPSIRALAAEFELEGDSMVAWCATRLRRASVLGPAANEGL